MGHKNLNKVLVPRVISMAEEFIIAPRRSHARTVRPRQWHVTRRGHIVERERALGRGLALAQLIRGLGRCLMEQALKYWPG